MSRLPNPWSEPLNTTWKNTSSGTTHLVNWNTAQILGPQAHPQYGRYIWKIPSSNNKNVNYALYSLGTFKDITNAKWDCTEYINGYPAIWGTYTAPPPEEIEPEEPDPSPIITHTPEEIQTAGDIAYWLDRNDYIDWQNIKLQGSTILMLWKANLGLVGDKYYNYEQQMEERNELRRIVNRLIEIENPIITHTPAYRRS
jgi:hypothetical protein